MNIFDILNIKKGQPVAWMVFYANDGDYSTTVYTLKEAEHYSKMAYDIVAIYR